MIIGFIGGMGCGKFIVVCIFEEFGCVCFDFDEFICDWIFFDFEVEKFVVMYFGVDVFNV